MQILEVDGKQWLLISVVDKSNHNKSDESFSIDLESGMVRGGSNLQHPGGASFEIQATLGLLIAALSSNLQPKLTGIQESCMRPNHEYEIHQSMFYSEC